MIKCKCKCIFAAFCSSWSPLMSLLFILHQKSHNLILPHNFTHSVIFGMKHSFCYYCKISKTLRCTVPWRLYSVCKWQRPTCWDSLDLKASLRISTALDGSTYFLLEPTNKEKRHLSSCIKGRFLCSYGNANGEQIKTLIIIHEVFLQLKQQSAAPATSRSWVWVPRST